MTRLYIKEVRKCLDCPSCEWDVCRLKGRVVDVYTLPDFCPLVILEKHESVTIRLNGDNNDDSISE